MAWILNRETGKYSQYDSQIGDIVEWEGEVRLSPKQAAYQAKRDGDLCGQCKGSCLVESGKACCHDLVRWGYCSHCPLEEEEGYEDLGNEGEDWQDEGEDWQDEGEDWQDEGEDWQDEGELDFSRSPRQERTPRTFLRRAEPRSLHPRPRQ